MELATAHPPNICATSTNVYSTTGIKSTADVFAQSLIWNTLQAFILPPFFLFDFPSIVFSLLLSVGITRLLAHFHDVQQQREPSSWPAAIHAVEATHRGHGPSSAFQ